jgi:antitoxin component YwqK of YwqJK toxin-antitoxin module
MLAVLLALALSPVRLAGQETRFFSSDEAGFQGEELQGLQAKGYTLAVAAAPSSSIRILYRDGKELRRTVRTATRDGTRESVLEGDVLKEERNYDRAGNLVEELFFGSPASGEDKTGTGAGAAGNAESTGGGGAAARPVSAGPPPAVQAPPGLVSRLVYAYLSGRLASVESFDASSRSQGKLEYRYDASGRLLELCASGSFGASAAGLAPGASLPAASWFAVPVSGAAEASAEAGKDALEITRYDPAGRPVERSSYVDGACVRAEAMIYGESGGLAESRAFEAGTRTMSETTYDPRGRVALVVTSVDGSEKSRESYLYDDASRLVESTLVCQSTTTRTIFAYDGPGEKSRETVQVNGVVVSVTVNRADGTVVKELYDRGALFLRSYHSEGRLRKEEFIENGSVVRTREYP